MKLPFLDNKTEVYFNRSIKEATLAYASVRGVNAVVSVLKGSELELSPAGIGVNIAAGEILDPIDDMTERLSSVVVAAIVSLGVQKIIYEIAVTNSLILIAILLPLVLIPIWLQSKWSQTIAVFVIKACLFIFIIRFLLPLTSMLNSVVYDTYFKQRISEAEESLSIVSSSYEDLKSMEKERDESFLSSITGSAQRKIERIKKLSLKVVDHADEIVASLIQLTILYMAKFLFQVLLLPVLFLWLAYKLVVNLFTKFDLNSFIEGRTI